MEFNELLFAAQLGDADAKEQLFLMYRPLIISRSMLNQGFDEDLYQVLSLTFLKCIGRFKVDKVKIDNQRPT